MSNKSQLKRVVTQSPEFAYLKITELETQLAERDAKIAALKAQLVGYAATIQRLGELTQQPIGFVQPEEMEKIKSLHHTRIYSVGVRVDTVSGHDGIALYAAPQAAGDKK